MRLSCCEYYEEYNIDPKQRVGLIVYDWWNLSSVVNNRLSVCLWWALPDTSRDIKFILEIDMHNSSVQKLMEVDKWIVSLNSVIQQLFLDEVKKIINECNDVQLKKRLEELKTYLEI